MPQRRCRKSGKAKQIAGGVARVLLGVCVLLTLSCNRSKVSGAESARSETPLARGDRVVVEQTAAVFFEGRVLAVDGQRLRVQEAATNHSLAVAASDVYRLSSARKERTPGRFAICNESGAEWFGCRVEWLESGRVRVVGADGKSSLARTAHVLVATPVTELNVRRAFERARERRAFMRGVEQAGRPRAPAGWKPALRGRVIAHRGVGWFSAKVHDVSDDGIAIQWDGDSPESELQPELVIPEPPYPAGLKRGDFVLIRPEMASQAWIAMRVAAVNGNELDVVNVNGDRRSVAAREVVPLDRP